MTDPSRHDAAWSRLVARYAQKLNLSAAVIVAALLRLCSIPIVGNFRHPQTWEFGPLAQAIAQGHGYAELLPSGQYAPAIYMPPAYSYVLAFFYRLGGEASITYLALEVVQAACGVLLVYVVYLLALILMGERPAVIAAFVTAVYPPLVYMTNEFHGISIYIVAGAAAVLFLARYILITRSWRDIFLAGVCGGTLMLFRGEGPALVILYALLLILRGGRRAAGAATVFVLVAFACIAPWMIRNYQEYGRIIPVCASGGSNLWIGNNARATGSQHYEFLRKPLPPDVQQALDQPIDKYYTVATDDAFRKLAVSYILTHPKEEAVLAAKKLFIFFVFDPSHEKGRSPVYWGPSVILGLFAAWGAVLLGTKRLFGDFVFLSTSVLFAVAIGMVVFVLPRYKIVIDPFLIVIASRVAAQHGAKESQLDAANRAAVPAQTEPAQTEPA